MDLSMEIEQDSKTFRASFSIDNKDPKEREFILNKYVEKILEMKQGHIIETLVGIPKSDKMSYSCTINLEMRRG